MGLARGTTGLFAAVAATALLGMGGAAHAQAATPEAAAPVDVLQELKSLREAVAAANARIAHLEQLVGKADTAAAPVPEGAGPPVGVAAAAQPPEALAELRGAGAAPATATIQVAQASRSQGGPVGEAPAPAESVENVIAALPDNAGVLTRPGHFVFEPSFNYSNSSSNRLVFRGVEIVTGVQIGVIEANTAARDTLVANGTLRYGVTSRAEVELRVPYIHREDRITTLAQRDDAITRTMHLDASGLGDVEFTGRYQLNNGGLDRPIIVANLRVKSDTGTSPYEIRRDEFGVAEELALGSGFWAVEPSLSALIVTDPAVIFTNISWLHSFPKNVNQTVGEVLIGRVEPGDSVGASMGFGFSINPRFSFSLGYRHNYIFRTKTEIGGTFQESESLQVGSLMMGMSYRVTEARSVNTQFEFGVTADAPNVSVVVRVPFAY